MKFLAFIMAFLVLTLSVMPCADTNEGKAKNELSKSGHQQKDAQQEDCSPFCTCTCCAGFSINHFIAALSSIPAYEPNLTTSFLSLQTMEVALPIWQPPQSV